MKGAEKCQDSSSDDRTRDSMYKANAFVGLEEGGSCFHLLDHLTNLLISIWLVS